MGHGTTNPGGGLSPLLEINNAPTGPYTIVAADTGKLVIIDDTLTIPTGLPVGTQVSVHQSNLTKQSLVTTGLTVNGNDQNVNISGDGIINLTITATDTVLLAGEMEA